MSFLRKSGSFVVIWIKLLAHDVPSALVAEAVERILPWILPGHISCQDPDTVVFGIPRSASSSHSVHCWPLLIVAYTHSTFSGVAGLPECGSLSTDSQLSLKHLCHTFICTALIASSPKASWIIRIVSTEELSSLMPNLMQTCCSTHSVILNMMTTQYMCQLNSVYWPHWLVQWSHHCSHMRIPVHSPWLPVTSMSHKLFSLY